MHDVGAIAKWRILVFPGGTEIGLEIRQALVWCKEVELYSASAPVSNHASFVFARHFVVPMVEQAGWLEALREVISRNRITHVFPAHDDALLALAENASQLGAKLVTSPVETCRITRSKVATARALDGILPMPKLFTTIEEVAEFPVFLKPDRGQGSQGVDCAGDREALAALHRKDPTRRIFEFLPGREFTVDCFSDRERGLLYASGRERRRIKSGIAMDSIPCSNSHFTEYARAINSVLKLFGAWFFQIKEDRCGILKVMEVAPRIGGTSALSRARGVNLPLLSLYEAEREAVSISIGDQSVEIDRALVNRYRCDLSYQVIYVDFDDTLVIRNEVNVELVKLLYQAVNRKIRLVLLTRHAGEIRPVLQRFRLEGLFDEIIHLRANESKANYIREKQSVLIDDSFAERTAVHNLTGIPVFDPGTVEVLFDERR